MDPQHKFDPRDDEIDLFELFESLWKEKVLIVAITFVITLLAGLYAFVIAKPVYEVSVKVKPEALEAVELLKTLSFGDKIKVDVNNYINFIESPEFIEALYLAGHFDKLFEGQEIDSPNDAMRVIPKILYANRLGDQKNPSIYPFQVTLEATDPLVGEQTLNSLLDLAGSQLVLEAKEKYTAFKQNRILKLTDDKQTLEAELRAKRMDEITRLQEADELQLQELNEELSILKRLYQKNIDDKIKELLEKDALAKKQLEEQLEIQTKSYFENLSDRIRSLEEAIGIAKSLDIIEPVALDLLIRKNEKPESGQVVEVNSNVKEDPLYMRGTRLLSAELEQLKSRPSDFIPDNEIKKIRDQLEALAVNNEIDVLRSRPEDFVPDEKIEAVEAKIDALKVNNKVQILKARTSDESFSEALQAIRAELAQLKVEEFPDDLRFDYVNGKAIAADRPVKPKRLLIVALAVVVGGMLGIVVALIRSASKKRAMTKAA